MIWDTGHPFVTLTPRSRSGDTKQFEVRFEPLATGGGGIAWFYVAKPLPPEEQTDDEYFVLLKQIDPGLMQVEDMKNGLPAEYRGFGITRALLPIIARARSAVIRSSTRHLNDLEMRSDEATRVWKTMVEDGTASYNSAEDRFYCPPQ